MNYASTSEVGREGVFQNRTHAAQGSHQIPSSRNAKTTAKISTPILRAR
jgi:hypothetical protein